MPLPWPKIGAMTWAGSSGGTSGAAPPVRRSPRPASPSASGLIVALLSIAAGVRNTASDLIHVGRADFGVFQEGASDLTRSLLPQSLEERIADVDGVDEVAGIFLRVTEVERRDSFARLRLRPRTSSPRAGS